MNNKRRPNNNMNGGNGNGGGQQRHHNNNRPRRFGGNNNRSGADDSANISRTRRNATQSREKYQNMARDAMSMGDRVLAESYLQHADHYYRVLMELPPEEVRQPYQQRNHHQGGTEYPVSHDHMEAAHHQEHEGQHLQQDADSANLPAFITHPSDQENLSQENL